MKGSTNMLTKITLVLAMCMHPSSSDVQSKLQALRKNNPDAVVSLRVDQKATCSDGQVLKKNSREEKILTSLK
jgi:hypothetical protein